ncbi:MAG TPA: FAD-dependent oxidoreductase [Anaerolineae bacterium]|nr:FAD-dependent oxidoreductase [Anaerolineae bacterium]
MHQQAQANHIDCQLLNSAEAHTIEPHCHAIAAIHIPSSGIVDYAAVARRIALRIEMQGGRIKTRHKVIGLLERPEGIIVQTEQGSFVTPYLVNAAGLHADRLAHKLGLASTIKLLPFRGEYYRLSEQASELVNGQIFPIPNPALPFTGIHLTRGLDGTVLCGPNAVLAGSREGYRKGSLKLRDALDQATSRRVRRLTRQHFATALWEKRRSWSKELFAMTVQRLVPAISEDDLNPAPSGVSTYAITPEGELLPDFVLESTPRSVHLLSLPTPGATACLSFGRSLAQTALDHV